MSVFMSLVWNSEHFSLKGWVFHAAMVTSVNLKISGGEDPGKSWKKLGISPTS